MKLSEMSNDRVFNFLTVAAAEFDPILSDPKVMTLSEAIKPHKGETQLDYGIRIAKTLLSTITVFSETHRQRIYRVFAEFYECPADDFGAKPFGETLKQLEDSFSDEVLISFLSSFKKSAQAP